MLPKNPPTVLSLPGTPEIAKLFATASVEIWLRSVHSFLISASLTNVSPIWASVSGYYSSHYCVRAFAHLLGHFQLFKLGRLVKIDLQKSGYVCHFEGKGGKDREHAYYWRIVKNDVHFATDDLFSFSNPDQNVSDVGHRNHANYVDHLGEFPHFHPLDEAALKSRISFISNFPVIAASIPRRSNFPDTASVQIMAFHRIVRYHDFLDQILGNRNGFWNVHRDPSWARDMMMKYHVPDPPKLEIPVDEP